MTVPEDIERAIGCMNLATLLQYLIVGMFPVNEHHGARVKARVHTESNAFERRIEDTTMKIMFEAVVGLTRTFENTPPWNGRVESRHALVSDPTV